MPRPGKGILSEGTRARQALSTHWPILHRFCQRIVIFTEPICSLAVCSFSHVKAALFKRISGVRFVKAYSTSGTCVSGSWLQHYPHKLTSPWKILQYRALHSKFVHICIKQGKDAFREGLFFRSHIDVSWLEVERVESLNRTRETGRREQSTSSSTPYSPNIHATRRRASCML